MNYGIQKEYKFEIQTIHTLATSGILNKQGLKKIMTRQFGFDPQDIVADSILYPPVQTQNQAKPAGAVKKRKRETQNKDTHKPHRSIHFTYTNINALLYSFANKNSPPQSMVLK